MAEREVEGGPVEGMRVLLVDDLTTDGGSKVAFTRGLRAAGAKVTEALCLFSHGTFPGGAERLGGARAASACPGDMEGCCIARTGRHAAGGGPRRAGAIHSRPGDLVGDAWRPDDADHATAVVRPGGRTILQDSATYYEGGITGMRRNSAPVGAEFAPGWTVVLAASVGVGFRDYRDTGQKG